MKVGDKVKVNDGSFSVRVDSFEKYSGLHGICEDTFEILALREKVSFVVIFKVKEHIHDVFIKNLSDGKIYLHSLSMLTLIDQPVKEITLAELEEDYGCKIKIIN
jgi:hypothetical protein